MKPSTLTSELCIIFRFTAAATGNLKEFLESSELTEGVPLGTHLEPLRK